MSFAWQQQQAQVAATGAHWGGAPAQAGPTCFPVGTYAQQPGQAQQQMQYVPNTPLAAALSAGHICSRFCDYGLEFGNVWKCSTAGTMHVCDANCDQRVPYDRYSEICRLSKRIFARPVAEVDMMSPVSRKRCVESDLSQFAANKRAITSP